uniref:glutathione transferase n=1 Tax=Pygocentrus nattereri TaxID=42514 RepID=A0AAR2ITY3_PYGNA
MSGKVVLYYFDGRGKMESIRWLLAVAGVEVCNRLNGALLFHQVPMVEMDGMKLVQSKAIMNYIAGKYNLYGKDPKERVMIDMYAEAARDIMDMISMVLFTSPDNKKDELEKVQVKAKVRTLPAFEKALGASQFLVGNQLSCADVNFFEASLMLEEVFPTILSSFPNIQAFQKRMKAIPAISKFLQPGSQRKPLPDDALRKTAKEVLSHLFK